MSEKQYLSGWRYRAVIFSAGAAALGYLGFSLWVGWQDVSSAIVKVGLPGVVIAMLMSMINYSVRFLRWQIYLNKLGHPLPTQPSFKMYLAGFALTTTPGRAGEALRGVLFKQWGVPYPKSFAAYFSERLSDLLAIALLTLLGLSFYPEAKAMILVGFGMVLICLVAISQRRLIERLILFIPDSYGKATRLAKHLTHILTEAQRCHGPGIFSLATLLGALACSSEALAFYWILNWIGAEVPITFAVFVYALSILAGALSFMPGGLGGTEAVMATLLIWKGVPHADAIAAVVLIRLCTLWFSVGVGMIALTKARHLVPNN